MFEHAYARHISSCANSSVLHRSLQRLTRNSFLGDATAMLHLFLAVVVACCLLFRHHRAWAVVWLSSLLCACSMTGSAATSSPTATMAPLDLSHHVVREVCWQPAEFGEVDANDDDNYFLPAYLKSPNPKGSIVHKILGNNDFYDKTVYDFLEKATSQADALRFATRSAAERADVRAKVKKPRDGLER
jgi:hypothetical protein